MSELNNHQSIENRAWASIIASFIAFCALTSAALYGARWLLFESETTQQTSLALISGDVLFTPPGVALPQAIVQSVTDLGEGTRVDTEAGSQAAVSFVASDQTTALGSLQLYGSSTIELDVFRSPRFEWSNLPHRMEINMPRGRARVSLAVDVPRQIVIVLKTPHGGVQLDRSGSYSIEVTSQATEVVVRDGAATVSQGGQSVIIATGERTLIKPGDPDSLKVETGDRNLILNGDFATPPSPADWTVIFEHPDPDDVIGDAQLAVESGRNTIHFDRPGRNWGRVGIQQRINRDVRDYTNLNLHLALKIVRQNILVCGTYGSECPVMVKIQYTDRAGGQTDWLQGFYYLADASNNLPTLCFTCPAPKGSHVFVTQNTWYSYDSPNLIELLNQPAIINTISIYAEGHSFESYVSEVELQAGD